MLFEDNIKQKRFQHKASITKKHIENNKDLTMFLFCKSYDFMRKIYYIS